MRTTTGSAIAVALLALSPFSAGHDKEKKHDASAIHRPDAIPFGTRLARRGDGW